MDALLEILSRANVTTIADVIATMESIDGALSSSDGLKWFNLMYLQVTQQVDAATVAVAWSDPAWLTRLDVVFATFYFSAVSNWLQKSPDVPESWKALFEARFSTGIDRIQFALCGMNAHINHDLAFALLQVSAEMNLVPLENGPQHDDYERVNGLLEAEIPSALTFLATGIVGEIAQDTGKIGRYLAIWSVRAARDCAWDFSDILRPLDPVSRNPIVIAQDRITGVLGRSLLLNPI